MTPTRREPALTDTQQRQLDYWTALNNLLLRSGFLEKPRQARPRQWMDYSPFGRSGITLAAAMHTREKWIKVALVTHDAPKIYYDRLYDQRAAIEAELGEQLDWDRQPANKRTLIGTTNYDFNPLDQSTWRQQHAWLRDTLMRFHRVFAPRIEAL